MYGYYFDTILLGECLTLLASGSDPTCRVVIVGETFAITVTHRDIYRLSIVCNRREVHKVNSDEYKIRSPRTSCKRFSPQY